MNEEKLEITTAPNVEPRSPKVESAAESKEEQASLPDTPEPDAATTQQAAPKSGPPSLHDIIMEQVKEEESPLSAHFTLKKILGGDILTTSTFRNQIGVFLLVAFFMIVYISNRYSCLRNIKEISELSKELQDAKYRALASNSQLTELSRQSNVLDMLKNHNDTTLHIAKQPPFVIHIEEE